MHELSINIIFIFYKNIFKIINFILIIKRINYFYIIILIIVLNHSMNYSDYKYWY